MGATVRHKKCKVLGYKKETAAASQTAVTHGAGKGQQKKAHSALYSVRVDQRGRVTLPAEVRLALGVEPGAIFYVRGESDGFRLTKAENPFDGLARYAVAEAKAGRTRDIREYAKERGFRLGGE